MRWRNNLCMGRKRWLDGDAELSCKAIILKGNPVKEVAWEQKAIQLWCNYRCKIMTWHIKTTLRPHRYPRQ